MAKPKNLSEESVEEIRRMCCNGETQSSVAKHFEISQSLVSKIVNNYIHKPPAGDLHVSGAAEVKVGYNYGN